MGKAWVSEPAFSYQSVAVDSIDVLKRPVDGADAEIVQLGKGCIKGRLSRATIGDLSFSRGSFSLPIRASGVLSRTRLTLGLLLRSAGPVRDSSGLPAVAGDIFIVPPGFDHHNVYSGPASFVGLTIDPIELATLFGGEAVLSQPEYWSRRHRCRPEDPQAAVNIDQRLRLVFAALARRKEVPATTTTYLKRVVLEGFAEPLATASAPRQSSNIASAVEIVRRVEHFVDAIQHRPVHISEICVALKISRRTLHRCFEDALGIGPGAFLRHKRLCSVHSALRQLERRPNRVTQIATEFGFLELSRFARQYHDVFGEYPHQTLRR
jgi:AraC-like DNA-binding protein